jgi:ribonuclease-3
VSAPDAGVDTPPASRAAVEAALGHRFADGSLLETALAHASYANEVDGSRGNERLEFLGDAVLDLVVARMLFEAHPEWTEGDLTRTRAALVNTRALARRARVLELGAHVRLGRTERKTGGSEKDSILACLLEALIGALYLDGGLAPAERFVRRILSDALAEGVAPHRGDPKTRFQEWAHAQLRATPRYALVADSGVENDDARFEVEVHVSEQLWGRGRGRTKRRAEQAAAHEALARARDASL